MKPTAEQIAEFHACLHESCNVDALRPSYNDQRLWWDFFREMEPLDETPDGPLSLEDIRAVIRHMQWECREGKASWSLRPTHILRNPESFRDLVLLCRKKRRKQPVFKPRESTPKRAPLPPEETVSPEEFSAMARRLREGGGA